MTTIWKKPIEKVPSAFTEKELLTMSFKEYWAQGLRELHPEMEIGPKGHLEPGGAGHKWILELERLTPGSTRGTKLRPYPEGHLWHGRSQESFYK